MRNFSVRRFVTCENGLRPDIEDWIFEGVENLSRSYLVDTPGLDGERDGVVEVPFDRALLERMLNHRGSNMLVAVELGDGAARVSIEGRVLGVSLFWTDSADFPEEAEDLALAMSQYDHMCWLFYVIASRSVKDPRVMRELVESGMDIMREAGCKYLVADYMIHPEVCRRGKRMMELAGFREIGRQYGLGLKSPEDRGAGNEDRDDVYEIMVRDLTTDIPTWARV